MKLCEIKTAVKEFLWGEQPDPEDRKSYDEYHQELVDEWTERFEGWGISLSEMPNVEIYLQKTAEIRHKYQM